jgi:hypothetical protein
VFGGTRRGAGKVMVRWTAAKLMRGVLATSAIFMLALRSVLDRRIARRPSRREAQSKHFHDSPPSRVFARPTLVPLTSPKLPMAPPRARMSDFDGRSPQPAKTARSFPQPIFFGTSDKFPFYHRSSFLSKCRTRDSILRSSNITLPLTFPWHSTRSSPTRGLVIQSLNFFTVLRCALSPPAWTAAS